MANWQRTIKLQPAWGKAQRGEITRQELAALIAKKLRAVHNFADEYVNEKRDDLVEEFDWMAGLKDLDADEFDTWMAELYDWGDIQVGGKFFDAKKVCWIDAMSGGE